MAIQFSLNTNLISIGLADMFASPVVCTFVSVGFHSEEPALQSESLEPIASDARELIDLKLDDVITAWTTSDLNTAPPHFLARLILFPKSSDHF